MTCEMGISKAFSTVGVPGEDAPYPNTIRNYAHTTANLVLITYPTYNQSTDGTMTDPVVIGQISAYSRQLCCGVMVASFPGSRVAWERGQGDGTAILCKTSS